VSSIHEQGFVESFNNQQTCLARRLQVSDRIIDVNGIHGDAAKMLRALRKASAVGIMLLREQ